MTDMSYCQELNLGDLADEVYQSVQEEGSLSIHTCTGGQVISHVTCTCMYVYVYVTACIKHPCAAKVEFSV